MKAKVPGAAASTGVKAQDFTLPKGDYVFEIGSVKLVESQNSPCMLHKFEAVVIDGPDDERGKTTQGRKFFHQIVQYDTDHPSYEAQHERSEAEIADLCLAAGVDLDDEGYETEDFPGKKVKAKLGVRMGKGADGDPRPENTIVQQKDEDGVIHLWLPDDGAVMTRPAKPATKSSSTKKSSGSKKR